VLRARDWIGYAAILLLWLAATVQFWRWWLPQSAHGSPWLFWPQTAALVYLVTVLPSLYWFFVGRMRRPVEPEVPAGLRVAMITLCVPAHESLEVIRGQLEALQAVEYPHDSWLLDEGDDPEVAELAAEVGVSYFSRRYARRWNAPKPPYQRATKAGNVNAWLDHVEALGIRYDAFVQMDIDHRPRPDYLHRTLGYFRDPRIAWVQAPSVCGNLECWTARGMAEQDLLLQGPLQMGFYGHSRTPFIIGSHTTYRTSAVREIGGFQPTRAEDHLDTVVLAAHGYRGVYVPELIAVGDGPADFATYLRQQFAWAYSMVQVFTRWTPKLIRRYSFGQAMQFLMAQSWYLLWSTSMAVMWVLPAVALISGEPIARVGLLRYLEYFAPLLLVSSAMWGWTARWFQPAGVRLSWRGVLLEIARWPVVLWAVINVAFGVTRPYMITPKGRTGQRRPRGASLYGPFIALATLSLAAVWSVELRGGHGLVRGYYLLALANAALALLVAVTAVGLEVRDIAGHAGARQAALARPGIAAVCLALAAVLTFTVCFLGASVVNVLG
jgi:cellulose synthase (UDP-forming)